MDTMRRNYRSELMQEQMDQIGQCQLVPSGTTFCGEKGDMVMENQTDEKCF